MSNVSNEIIEDILKVLRSFLAEMIDCRTALQSLAESVRGIDQEGTGGKHEH